MSYSCWLNICGSGALFSSVGRAGVSCAEASSSLQRTRVRLPAWGPFAACHFPSLSSRFLSPSSAIKAKKKKTSVDLIQVIIWHTGGSKPWAKHGKERYSPVFRGCIWMACVRPCYSPVSKAELMPPCLDRMCSNTQAHTHSLTEISCAYKYSQWILSYELQAFAMNIITWS